MIKPQQDSGRDSKKSQTGASCTRGRRKGGRDRGGGKGEGEEEEGRKGKGRGEEEVALLPLSLF